MPSLHVSVPGQGTTSTIVLGARRDSRLAAFSSLYRAGRSASLTQRSTMFCSTVVRMVSRVYLRAMSASERSWSEVMSPSGRQIVTVAIARLALPVHVRVVPLLELRDRRSS